MIVPQVKVNMNQPLFPVLNNVTVNKICPLHLLLRPKQLSQLLTRLLTHSQQHFSQPINTTLSSEQHFMHKIMLPVSTTSSLDSKGSRPQSFLYICVQIYGCIHKHKHPHMYVCMCMYVCMYVCMFACMYVIPHTSNIFCCGPSQPSQERAQGVWWVGDMRA